MLKRISFALVLRGFTCLALQTILIREFLISAQGNELTIGLILAIWITQEGLGSIAFSRISLKIKDPRALYALLQVTMALYLPLSIFLIRNLKNIPGSTYGEGLGFTPLLFFSFIILLPLSFLDGAQFPLSCRISESAGKAYVLEAFGFILSGAITAYLLILRFDPFLIALFLGILNLGSAFSLAQGKIKKISGLLLLLSIFACFGPAEKLHQFSLTKQWPKQKIIKYQNSLYGNLVITEKTGQFIFYSNGVPILTAPVPDIRALEELAHFTLLSHPHPENILVLGGGPGGLIKEILKYPVKKITYAEIDPALIKMLREIPAALIQEELNDKRLEIRYIDARKFLQRDKAQYDIIILNLPAPSTLQLNRFYTREFFQNVKTRLSGNGIFSFNLPGSLSYLTPSLRGLNSSILNTLREILHVRIIPGDNNLYLAAKREFSISPDIFSERLQKNNIRTALLNPSYLKERLDPQKLAWFDQSLAGYRAERKNSDLSPTAVFYAIEYWNDIFSRSTKRIDLKLIFILLLLSAVIFTLLNPKKSIVFAIGSTGFVGLGLEIALIYAYQAFYGYVFSQLGLLIAAFMAGLMIGGWLGGRVRFWILEAALMLFPLAVAETLPSLAGNENLSFLLFAFTVALGFLVGAQFTQANRILSLKTDRAGAILYTADLFGAASAAFFVSLVLFPELGILNTCVLLAGLKAFSLANSILPVYSCRRIYTHHP